MKKDEIRIKVIEKINKTFKWLNYIGWSNKNPTYNLLKFEDSIGDLILWVYIFEEDLKFEFRKVSNAEIDKEYKDIKFKDAEKFIGSIKYIY